MMANIIHVFAKMQNGIVRRAVGPFFTNLTFGHIMLPVVKGAEDLEKFELHFMHGINLLFAVSIARRREMGNGKEVE